MPNSNSNSASPIILDIITFSPMRIPFGLKAGVSEQSKGYYDLLSDIKELAPLLKFPALEGQKKEYESLSHDVHDMRLFIWQDLSQNDFELYIHVFPNFVAIAELRMTYSSALAAQSDTEAQQSLTLEQCQTLEQDVQSISDEAIHEAYVQFHAVIERIYHSLNHPLLMPARQVKRYMRLENSSTADIFWTARTIVLQENQLDKENIQFLIKNWLAETQHPEDAQAIISHQKRYSMTWLNYILVDDETKCQRFRMDAMLLAQYFYTAQDISNQQLKRAISSAYVSDTMTEAQENLTYSRASVRLHLIAYYEHLKYLTRSKKVAVGEILGAWEFERLVENGQRMVEVCSSKLEESNNKKREHSSFLTDLILVSLSFFAVFELALYLTEFSREMMSRPALDYNDDNTSAFLSFIANVDADIMISMGIVITIILFIIYSFVKTR